MLMELAQSGLVCICGHQAHATPLVYQGLSEALLRSKDGLVYYIDTLGSLDLRYLASVHSGTLDNARLECLKVVRAFDIYGLIQVLDEIGATGDRVELVMVNSFSHPVGLLMAKGMQTGHALMVSVLRSMRGLIRHKHLDIILFSEAVQCDSNVMSAFIDTDIRPALGTTFPHLVDEILLVRPWDPVARRRRLANSYGLAHPDNDDDARDPASHGVQILETVRSSSGRQGNWTAFRTNHHGQLEQIY